jgi:hypothetical protein
MKTKADDIFRHIFEDEFDFDATIKEVDALKKSYQQRQDEENANIAWATLSIIKLHQEYRESFSLLQAKQYYRAWCLLEQMEIRIANVFRNFPGLKSKLNDISIIVSQIQSLYPYRLFFSTVILVNARTCSICGKKRSIRHHCGHFPGRVYNGELCHDKVEKSVLRGVDLVKDPEHKYAVPFLNDEEGRPIDQYNYCLLDGLMNIWLTPYSTWHYTTEHIHKPPMDYPGLSDNSPCPCGSGELYMDCCKNDPKGVKHIVYVFAPGLPA